MERKFNKYDRLYQMQVSYEVDINATDTNTQLNNMGSDLMDLLSTIDVEYGTHELTLPIIGRHMDYKIVDDVMQFFVSYPMRVYKQLDGVAKQEQLTINTNTKNGG